MKRLFLLIIILSFASMIFSQQFSLPIYFQDAIGNKDTIILGYDNNGTDSIDAALGETNIISVPLDSSLDVRITNEWLKRNKFYTIGTFHTKKQIVNNSCGSWLSLITIDIYTKHWPITASWDSSLFNNYCLNGSVLTSVNPRGWWETGSPSNLLRVELKNYNKVTFTSNVDAIYNNNYAYINSTDDTIPVFWQMFADSTLLLLNVNKIKGISSFRAFPNPADDYLNIETGRNFNEFLYKIYDIVGKEVYSCIINTPNKQINVSSFHDGVYIQKLISRDHVSTKKLIIKH